MATFTLNKPLVPGDACAPALVFSAPGASSILNQQIQNGGHGDQGVRYDIMSDSPVLEYEPTRRTAVETYIMQSHHVAPYAAKALGLEIPFVNAPFYMRNKRRFPGNVDLIASRITARPFEGRPADPLITDVLSVTDLSQWLGKYSRHMLVTTEYTTEANIEPSIELATPRRPETFTEVRVTTGGEFINVGHQSTYWLPCEEQNGGFTRKLGNFRDARINALRFRQEDCLPIVPAKLNLTVDKTNPGALEENNEHDSSLNQIVGTKEWTIVWRHVFAPPRQTINSFYGHVNSTVMRLFDFAPCESVLFVGADIVEEALPTPAPNNFFQRKMYTVEYKFMERQVREVTDPDKEPLEAPPLGGETIAQPGSLKAYGWNHFWRPGAKGKDAGEWQRLVVDKRDGRGPYKTANFLHLFFGEEQPFFTGPTVGIGLSERAARDSAERGRIPGQPTL